MTLKYNPFTHKFDYVGTEGGPSGNLTSLTGTSGGPVYGDSNGNISLLLPGGSIVGDPTSHNLTFNPASGGSFSPNSTIQLSDDFIGTVVGGDPAGTILSNYVWGFNTSTGAPFYLQTQDNGHPGILAFYTSFNAGIFLSQNQTNNNVIILGGGAIVLNWVFKIENISVVTDRYNLRLGLGDTSGSDQVNGCYFEYTDTENSGNWVLKTASASAITTTNTSTSVTSGWHNAQITINAAASSVNFTMDGVSLGNITTNIPTTAIDPFLDFSSPTGIGQYAVYLDLFYLTQSLTTSR